MAAMVDTQDDGRTVEVGVIGHEGMVGINIFLGSLATPDRAMHGYAESNEFEMSQESIAAMLGARRVGITEAAGILRARPAPWA